MHEQSVLNFPKFLTEKKLYKVNRKNLINIFVYINNIKLGCLYAKSFSKYAVKHN